MLQVKDYIASRMSLGGFIDDSSNKFYIFGGLATGGPQNDLWSFHLEGLYWIKETYTGDIPPPRNNFACTKYTDSTGLKFAIFGGNLAGGQSNQVHV